MVSKKELMRVARRLAELLAGAEEMRPLIGRRVVGVEFNGEAEGAYTLKFDDGSTVTFSSCGDDATFTSMELTPFQKSVVAKLSGKGGT